MILMEQTCGVLVVQRRSIELGWLQRVVLQQAEVLL